MRKMFFDLRDGRTRYIAGKIKEKTFDFEKDFSMIESGDIVILPPSFKMTREVFERLPEDVLCFGGKLNFESDGKRKFVNLLESESFVRENARLTAEGFLAEMIVNTNSSIFSKKILLIGSGHVAKAVLSLFVRLNIPIEVAMRNEVEKKNFAFFASVHDLKDLNDYLKDFDVIVNTATAEVLTKENCFKEGSVVFELSSTRCFLSGEKEGVRYIILPALPGKYFPVDAGEAIFAEVKKVLKEDF